MRRAWALILVVGLLAAACGGTTPSGVSGPSAASVAPGTSGTPGGQASGGPQGSPGASQAAASNPPDTVSPAPGASQTPLESPGPSSSLTGSGSADACTGSADNKAFYAQLAASVGWDVYCAVLPKGWVVSTGQYRLANGGKLTITYKGPDGATLSLSEGSFCTDGTGCVPSGTAAGDATFGDMPGSLVATDSGGYAVVVAQGQQPSWLMVTGGLDQATSVALGAALAKVAS